MDCPRCGSENQKGAEFCNYCSWPFKKGWTICSACNATLKEEAVCHALTSPEKSCGRR